MKPRNVSSLTHSAGFFEAQVAMSRILFLMGTSILATLGRAEPKPDAEQTGDEKGVADTLKLSGLDVPVLILKLLFLLFLDNVKSERELLRIVP